MGVSLIGPAIGAIGSIVGSSNQASAASDAAAAQQQSAAQAIAEQKYQYDTSRGDQQPYMQAGVGALGQMQQLNAGNMASFHASPDYAWTQQQGIAGLDASAAARGSLYSGGHSADLLNYNQGLAEQQYGNYYSRLASMAGLGQNAAAGVGNLGAQSANSISNSMIGSGNAAAQGIIGGANAWSNGLAGAANAFGQLSSSSFGGGLSGQLPGLMDGGLG